MTGVTDAISTAVGDASSNAISAIGTVLPSALAIMGAIIVITVAIRVFKRASN